MKSKLTIGYIYVILSAVIYGCMPIMAKYIYAEGVNSVTLVFLRNFLALPALAVLSFIGKRKRKCIPVRPILLSAIPAFFGCVITPILLFSSYNYLNSGVSTVFHFVYPSLVLLIGVFFLRKKPSILTLLGVAVCFVGILFFYDPSQTPNTLGSILALGSGLTFAVYVTILPRFQSEALSGFTFGFYIAAWSSVMMLLMCLVSMQLDLPKTLSGWGLSILFAMLVTVGAVILFQQGTLIIGGVKSSVLSALEPITSVIIGMIVFHEPCKFTIIIGATLIIASGIIIAVSDLKNKKN